MSCHRKRPTVLPERASHGTACASRHPDAGEADREHPETGSRTVGVDRADAGGPRYRGQRRHGVPAHIRWSVAFFAAHGFSACETPLRRPVSPLVGEPSTGEPDAGDPHVRFGGRGRRTQSALPTPIMAVIGTAGFYPRAARKARTRGPVWAGGEIKGAEQRQRRMFRNPFVKERKICEYRTCLRGEGRVRGRSLTDAI